MERSPETERTKLTEAVREASGGSPSALDTLFDACYDELRRLAHKCLVGERPGHTLQTTELVHEAYLRLVETPKLDWKDRAHFFAVASRVMRHILVDHARRRRSVRRLGTQRRVTFDEALAVSTDSDDVDLEAIDEALTRLHLEMPEKARVVEMRFFGGMTHEEIAVVMHMAPRTVRRYGAYAQARLYELMQERAT